MNNYRLAIFDLDGTLLYTLEDLKNSTNYALEQFGMPIRTLDEVRSFVGNGIHKLIERAITIDFNQIEMLEGRSFSEEEKAAFLCAKTDAVLEVFTAHYKVHYDDNTVPFPGIIEALDDLKNAGVLIAVVSNKVDKNVKDLVNKHFPDTFDFVLGETETIRRKPAPDMVEKTLAELKVEKADAVYIGDSEVDCQTAINSGLDLIAVDWGFRSVETLKNNGAKTIISDASELNHLIINSSQNKQKDMALYE